MSDTYSIEVSNEGYRYINKITHKESILYKENYDIVWDIYLNFHEMFDKFCKAMMKY